MTGRRDFFKQLGYFTGGLSTGQLLIQDIEDKLTILNQKYQGQSDEYVSTDEAYWATVRSAYRVSEKMINFNNGGVSPHPLVVEEAMNRFHAFSNSVPSFDMWRKLDLNREPLREKLSALAHCQADEIAIQRNASEAIETVIFGLPLKKGDEVILTKQDYPNMINAWKQRAQRDKIKLVWLDFDFPIEDKAQIVDRFAKAITSKTKLLHVTHVINWMGQILPVKELATLAHDNGAEILVDGAHSFAHFEFSLSDFDCDYFGTSLHKWLGAPFGTGMLFVKKNKIKNIYPLFAAPKPKSGDIRKFEHLGTRSFPIEQAITQAIYFHNKIGIARKESRLRHLKDYWATAATKHENVSVGTSLLPDFSCGIALLKIKDISPNLVANRLLKEHQIHAVAINWHNIEGVRITPNVYSLKSDMDTLIEGIQSIASS